MKPLLKWAGGKRHIAEQLKSAFPADWNLGTYIEPFLGGAGMYLHLNPPRALVADINARLVNFYKQIKENPREVFESIYALSQEFDSTSLDFKKERYLSYRERFNNSDVESIDSAALLYVLNKLCFNGLYRENSRGGFNVPFGQKKFFPHIGLEEFLEVSSLLMNTEILKSDFEGTISKAQRGDFIYLDPPYVPKDATSSFTSYHSEGFGIEDQRRLARAMIELSNSGIKAMLSNSDTELTRQIYGDLNIKMIQAPRMVSAKASGRGPISELVITNY